MRLTVEEDRDTIKRYGHIGPAPAWGAGRCSVRCPGTERTCTLAKDHRGPHVAHGLFRRVMAVWDTNGEERGSRKNVKTAVAPRAHGEVWTGSLFGSLAAFWDQVVALRSSVGDIALFVMFLGFVAFAIRWLLLIFP